MRPSIFVNRGELALARPFDPCTPLLSSHGASPHLCYQKHSHLSFIHSHTNFHGYSIKWLSPDNVSIAYCKTALLSMQLAQSCVNSSWPSDIKYCNTDVGQHWPGTLAQVKQLLLLGTIPEFDVAMILILRRLARLFACNAVAAVLC